MIYDGENKNKGNVIYTSGRETERRMKIAFYRYASISIYLFDNYHLFSNISRYIC
jgi:hypothetical protein